MQKRDNLIVLLPINIIRGVKNCRGLTISTVILIDQWIYKLININLNL